MVFVLVIGKLPGRGSRGRKKTCFLKDKSKGIKDKLEKDLSVIGKTAVIVSGGSGGQE
jgi:hypothetical protein